jgi:pimeloyl-ACP methyl ester carboxylesterase
MVVVPLRDRFRWPISANLSYRLGSMSDVEPNHRAPRRGCAAALGILLAAPAAALSFAWLSSGLSWWSALLALGLVLLVLGLLFVHASPGLSHRLLAAGGLLVLGPWLVRVVWVRGSEQARVTTLPGDGGSRLVSRLYPEGDGSLAAAALLRAVGGLRDAESAEFPNILKEAYARTNPSAQSLPTPAIATYLGLQSPTGFDTIVIRPPEQRVAADAAVVFLHGYAGNFYVYCWEMAQAAAAANLLTLCPSTGPAGAWWEANGEQTLLATLDYAHDIGMNRVYLAGLSNGAAGASMLALQHQRRLAGLVLVSGMRAETPPSLPVLVVQGATDKMMPAAYARTYAARGANVKYHEIRGGHFVFLSEVERVRPLIAEFLGALEKRATALPRGRAL